MAKRKPPGRRIQLKTAEAQIKQNAVNSGKAPLACDFTYLIKGRLGHAQSAGADFAGKALPNSSDGRGVNVQPQYLAVTDPIFGHLVTAKPAFTDPIFGNLAAGLLPAANLIYMRFLMRHCCGEARVMQQELGMAAAAQGSVDETSPRLNVQAGQHFSRQNGAVLQTLLLTRDVLHARRGLTRHRSLRLPRRQRDPLRAA